MGTRWAEYAIYKGDELICVGDVEECARILGIKEKSVYHLSSNAYKRQVERRKFTRSKPRIAYRIDKEDEE